MMGKIKKILFACFSTICATEVSNAARILNENPSKEDWQCSVVDGEWSCERSEPPVNVFSKNISDEERENALAKDMIWMGNKSYRTGGEYYNDTSFTSPLCKTGKTTLGYDNAEFDTDGTLIASGNVEVFQCDQEIYGQNAIISFNNDKTGIESVILAGDVLSREPSSGVVIRTEHLSANLEDDTASSGETYFRFFKKTYNTKIYNKSHFTGHLRGYSNSFKRLDKTNYSMTDGYITSGGPYDNDWKITADYMDVDTEANMAYIKNGWFKVKDIPVMYMPYFAFPTNDDRKSGFLTPGFVQNANSGWGVSVPYYFNLAPNYDFLFNQVYWLERGPMENGTFRYMTDYFQGEFEGSLVPYDFETQQTRGAFTLSNSGDFQNGIKTNLRYDYVSDSQFYDDFSAGNVNLVTKTLLDREFDVSYVDSTFNTRLQFLDYGIVNQKIFLANIPYAKLPEFRFNVTSYGYTPDYVTVSANTLNTYFHKQPHTINNSKKAKIGTQVDAFRGYESPKLAFDLEQSWGFFKPSIEVPIRYYQLNSQSTDIIKFNQSSISSVIPIFNIDAGAYFDREFTTSNGAYTQSFEPRLFYTYIPYQDQSDLPLFDTNITNESYMQMFQVNRFSGHDRINNANQVTYAFESKTINQEDGSTLFEAKIGQQIFFADRLVSLCQGNQKCTNKMRVQFYDSRWSPIMSEFKYQVMKNLYASANVNYRIEQNNVDYQVYQLQYRSEDENIFNISYNNIANNWAQLTQADINAGRGPTPSETVTGSLIYGLTDSWAIAVLANYNFKQNKFSNTFAALQYDANSWAIRGLVQATSYTNENPNDTTFLGNLTYTYLLEIELKGIGGVYGKNGFAQRISQINGYEQGSWGV